MRISKGPVFGCCLMYPTDRELEIGTTDVDLSLFAEDSFQGFAMRAAKVTRRHRPAGKIADDLMACGFNVALIVGFCGSNFRPEDIRSNRFVELVRECKRRGIDVGVCIPFADTVDNYLTRQDPKMHQLTRDGKRPYVRFDPAIEKPPCPIYIIDYGCEKFIQFAREIVLAAKDAGMSFIDYAEPDYWPTENNGYGAYLAEAYHKKYGRPLPYPSNLQHRQFMEDYYIGSLKRISEFAHRHGIMDHLTASPMGHSPYHICQNYGKYSTTAITQLSSTYHPGYGFTWRDRIRRRYDVNSPGHRFSSIACFEVRYMRGWGERHATYLVPGQSLPVGTYANALDQQMFLQNMDIFFWEYPSIRENYYETAEKWISSRKAWPELKAMFKAKSEKYRLLPSSFHGASPVPAALVYYSKRSVYMDPRKDRSTPCAYATALKLQGEHLHPGFLYPEYLHPLENRKYQANMLLIDEHQSVSEEVWGRIRRWLAKGSRVVIYGGRPGREWDTGREQRRFSPEMERLFGIRWAKCGRNLRMLTPRPLNLCLPSVMAGLDVRPAGNTQVLMCVREKPFVTIRSFARQSFAVYIAGPICELPATFLSELCSWLLHRAGKKTITVSGPLDVETCLFRNGTTFYLTVKNHSGEKRCMKFGVGNGRKPKRITELMTGTSVQEFSYSEGRTAFADVPDANSVRIYEVAS